MFDDLHHEGPADRVKRERQVPLSRPLSDREVPLGPPGTQIAESVHAWLDGEIPESGVRRSEWARDVDFWKRLNDDLESRRWLRTPVGLQARIMEALPYHAPTLITPWWRREFVVTPGSALVAAATLVAIAATATAMVMRLPH